MVPEEFLEKFRKFSKDQVIDLLYRSVKNASLCEDIYTNTKDHVWVIDPEYRFLIGNRQFHEDYKKQVGRDIEPGDQIIHDEVPRKFSEPFSQLFREAFARNGLKETISFDTNGRINYSEIEANVIRDEQEQVVGLSCISRDVTDFIEAEERVAESEKKYRLLAENTADVIWMMDPHCNFTYVSPSISRLSGHSVEEFKLQGLSFFIDSRKASTIKSYCKSCREDPDGVPRIITGKAKIKNRKGKEIWTETSMQAIFSEEGAFTGLTGIMRNISEQKKYEDELIEAKEDLEKTLALKEFFVSTLSHEIRNPLYVINSISRLLAEGTSTTQKDSLLRSLVSTSKHLTNLVNDILDYSKQEADEVFWEEADFNFKKMIEELVDIYKIQAGENLNDFTVEFDSQIPEWIVGDEGRIRQVLDNLISNALKFTREGKVGVNIKQKKISARLLQVQIQVKDSGVGIEKKELKQIFDPFFRGIQSSKQKVKGTGLGLSIVKNIVDANGGLISINSEKNKGTVANITLNLKPSRRHPGIVKENLNLEGLRLLYVEDALANQLLFQSICEPEKIDLTLASDGPEALELVKKNDFDIIFMDLRMPGMDGYETISNIRNFKHCTRVPVIMFSAHTPPNRTEIQQQYNINDWVRKPVSKCKLLEVIARHLNLEIEVEEKKIQNSNAPVDEIKQINPTNYKKMLILLKGDIDRLFYTLTQGIASINYRAVLDARHQLNTSLKTLNAEQVRAQLNGIEDIPDNEEERDRLIKVINDLKMDVLNTIENRLLETTEA